MKDAVNWTIRREGKSVYFKVVQMDENLRGVGELFEGELFVRSLFEPQILSSIIYLRGTRQYLDGKSDSLLFTSIKEAEEYVEKVNRTLKAFNESRRAEPLPTEGKEYSELAEIKADRESIASSIKLSLKYRKPLSPEKVNEWNFFAMLAQKRKAN